MASPIRIISSMATTPLLADLLDRRKPADPPVEVESMGGVDALKRVQAGEAYDVVVLAAKVIDQLIAEGHMLPGSRVDLVNSGAAVAVRAGAPRADIGSEDALKASVLAARTIGFSTGPSGVYLTKLFERWGIADQVKARIVTAKPGVPVGSLIASGEVELGFQQLSELMHVEGIDILGPLPPAVQLITTFSAGIVSATSQLDAVRALLSFMASPDVADIKRKHGMEPA